MSDITPVYLTPPDAGAAFANGSIDAWAIWDPYFAIGEKQQNGRILVNAHEVAKTNSFYLANRDFAEPADAAADPRRHRRLAEAAQWAESAPRRGREGARRRHRRSARGPDRRRQPLVVRDRPVTDDIITTQQARRRPLPQARPDPEADHHPRHRLDASPDLIARPVFHPTQRTEHGVHSTNDRGCRCCRSASSLAVGRRHPTAQDKVVRIGFQKYGKLVLLKSKGTLEEKLKAARLQSGVDRIPVRPAAARSAQCRRDRFRQYRRSAADLRAGRRRADPVRRL